MSSLATEAKDEQRGNSSTGGTSGKAAKYGTMARNSRLAAVRASTVRLNSTSTLYVEQTLSQPDNKSTIRSVARAVAQRISGSIQQMASGVKVHSTGARLSAGFGGAVSGAAAMAAGISNDEALQDMLRPSSPETTVFDEVAADSLKREIPTTGQVEYIIRHIFKTGQLSVDCNIIALVYIDRLLATGMSITVRNWRPILVIAMILASKVWDDLSMINEDFSTFLPFSLSELNKWEVKYLNALSFNVRVKASEYAKYYFDLRKTAITSKIQSSPGEVPLDSKAAHKLEALSASAQARFEALYGAVPDSSGSIYNLAALKINRIERSSSDISKTSGGAVKGTHGRSVLS